MFKNSLKRLLIGSGAMRLASQFVGGGVAIIMYHSVQDDPSEHAHTLGDIAHSTEVFRRQMEVVAGNFNPVRLDDVLLFLSGAKELPRRSVVVTFDDGYSDNFHIARQVLDQLGIPAVFYVVVDCIDRQVLPWPCQLRRAFLTRTATSWRDSSGCVWPLTTCEERLQAFEQASNYCAKLCGDKQRAFLDAIGNGLHSRADALDFPTMMSWDQIRSLIHGGHRVGSHTMTHPNMAHISDSEAQAELSESKRRLEEEIRQPVIHFSYPCPALQPHWTDSTVNLSRQLGYQTGVTANGGIVRQQDNPLRLHRVRPTMMVEGLRWNLEYRFAGGIG